MNQLVSSGLWKEIRRLAKKSKVRMAAVAYVTGENITFGRGDLLITDASKQAVESGQTSAATLRRAYERGAELFSCPGLHAKVMLFDGMAVIGSANISQSSENRLIEAALLTDQQSAVSMARAFIQELRDNSKEIDAAFIERISAIKVKKRVPLRGLPGKKPDVSVKLGHHRTWFVSVKWIDEERYEAELPYIEKGEEKAERLLDRPSSEVGWIRCTQDKSRFIKEAKKGDSVIQIWRESSKSKKPDAVYFYTPILLRQREPNCVRFFIENPANYERTSLTWQQFLKLAKRVGVPFKISRHTTRLLPEGYSEAFAALWKESLKGK